MSSTSDPKGSFRGLVYGDLIGTPYMIENTDNRYFPLGETRRAYSHGRVRSFFPEVTEVSHGSAAVCNWLSVYRDNPTAEALQKCLRDQFLSHPRGGWTEPTRLFLSSGSGLPSETPDWAALTRTVPIAAASGESLFRALELTEACVRATCSNDDTVMVAQALTHGIFIALHGGISAEVFTTLEMQYGLHLIKGDEDLRAELRGEVKVPLEMMGAPVPGAFHYVMPEHPAPPSARTVAEAAVKAVVRSDSWEDAVRRAVAYGGPSNAVAGIAGGLAEALYGEVTPSVVGKLFPYIPTDIVHQIESFRTDERVRVSADGSPFAGLSNDAFTVIRLGGGEAVAVVPEERRDIRRVLKAHPETRVITPSEADAFLERYRDARSGTYPYGIRPESCTYYLQDGKRIVSPTHYIAPGMPSLQERKRHLKAFRELRTSCVDIQRELNAAAHNPGAGQIHYEGAYHLWIGRRRIDFFMGDHLAGAIVLGERGLLRLELGSYRDVSLEARFQNHREQAWASRSLFSIAEATDPVSHTEDILSSIRERLLDEGLRDGTELEADSRYLSPEQKEDLCPVSNIDRLDPLEPGEDRGALPSMDERPLFRDGPRSDASQAVNTVYSIGYGARSREGFINTVSMMGVSTVIDIRSTPKSRFCPQFDADSIYEALTERDIAYFTAGEKLGGRPSDRSLYDASGQVQWDALRESDSYREGIEAILRKAAEGEVVAVVCSEGDPLLCHRFGTVARDLSERGMDVRHILSNGEVVGHSEMESRLVEKYERKGILASGVCGSYANQLSEAYSLLNEDQGFRNKGFRRRISRARKVIF